MRTTTHLMLSTLLAIAAGLYASTLAQSERTDAPSTYFATIHGTVQVEDEQGNRKPSESALVEAYGLDRGGHWSVQTDSHGRYTINLPYSATYLMVISGPGLMPLWDNKMDPKQADVIDFITYPGAGNRLSQTQIRELRGNRRSREVIAFYDQKTHYKVTPTAEQRAGYFRSIHDREATVKSAHELKVESDRALERYNNAVWLKVGREYQRALDEFAELLPYEGSSDEYLAKIGRASVVNTAEAHYLWAIDLFDKGTAIRLESTLRRRLNVGIGSSHGPRMQDKIWTTIRGASYCLHTESSPVAPSIWSSSPRSRSS